MALWGQGARSAGTAGSASPGIEAADGRPGIQDCSTSRTQGAALQEHQRSDARPVVDRVVLNVEDGPEGITGCVRCAR